MNHLIFSVAQNRPYLFLFFISKKLHSSVKSSYKAGFAASLLEIEGSLSIYLMMEFYFLFILTKKLT